MLIWRGTTSNDWNNVGNWAAGVVIINATYGNITVSDRASSELSKIQAEAVIANLVSTIIINEEKNL